ncbi:hypothetical protein [Desulfovibrio fairfieldensis]|uniref:hypothetical protein n=1 Tax=Desulfovibrio fairfieldensis TaxID=44742 RepID=UPI001237213A|nr:hypothetical protein [Desulfovibrio fairfieldensis]
MGQLKGVGHGALLGGIWVAAVNSGGREENMPKSPARVRVKGFSKAKALHGEGQLVSGGPTSPEIKKKAREIAGLKFF